MASQPVDLTREDLGKLQGITPRAIRAFENINLNQDELVQNVGDIRTSPVIGVALSPIFDNDRVLAGSADVLLTDGGAKGNLTISLTPTGVSAGNYGSATMIPRIAVDGKGRITLAAQFPLNSDNVTEGSTNLFFTTARARNSLSDGAGIDYDPGTGVIAVIPAGAYGTPTGALSRTSFATYSAPTISNPPTQAEVQAIADALQIVSRTLGALITDMEANGNLS